MDPERLKRRALNASVIGCTLVFLFSIGGGLLVDSISLVLDGACTFITLLVTVAARKVLEKLKEPPDERFHYGYAKYEPLMSGLEAAMIVIAIVVGFYFAVQDIIHPDDLTRYDVPLAAAGISVAISVVLALVLRRVARQTNSALMRTAYWQWIIDGLFSFGIFLGFLLAIVLRQTGHGAITPYIDPVMCIVLSFVSIRVPISILRHDLHQLLDEGAGAEIDERIRKAAAEHADLLIGVHKVRTRQAGPTIFVHVELSFDRERTVGEALDQVARFSEAMIEGHPDLDLVVSLAGPE